ncbi:MAG TPA: Asp-tRNA(Asn)/Glu-tRNA(Gln) amidotransferase subunit GatC [Anaerolineales bacterium]|nr:Asp-tRNA(Asn)/Glu-tRNA(Gln) amidotransferase subunit GatC [Anaerolineales bacterium]
MALTLAEVEHIAALARLRLTDEEKARYREQLSAILDYMAKLRQLDTSAIEPTATVLPLRTVLRPDVVTPSLTPVELLANAPEVEAEMFRVPPVLE